MLMAGLKYRNLYFQINPGMNCGQRQLEQKWPALPFGEVRFTSDDEQHVFAAQLYLDKLDPESVCVELYANGLETGTPERIEMKAARQPVGAVSGYAYHAEVPATRPAADYTARVIPRHACLAVPLEANRILWHR